MTGASFDMFQIHNLSETHLHCSNKTCLGILPCFKDNYDGCFVNKPNLLAEAAHVFINVLKSTFLHAGCS